MTHKDIYIKFAIEYDNTGIISKPTLTEYDIAVFLDKAYDAVIAQKITQNNFRRSAFESDTKAIEDLRPLLKREAKNLSKENSPANNVLYTQLPKDMLYYIDCYLHAIKNDAQPIETRKEIKIQEGVLKGNNPWKLDVTVQAENIAKMLGVNVAEIKAFVEFAKYGFIVSTHDEALKNSKFEYSEDNKKFICFGFKEGSTSYVLDKPVIFNNIEEQDPLFLKQFKDYALLIPYTNKVESTYRLDFVNKVYSSDTNPYDQVNDRLLPTKIISHEYAKDFFTTSYNMPWIKIPVVYIEDDTLFIAYDLLNDPIQEDCEILYIHKPNKFVKDLDNIKTDYDITFFDCPDNAEEDIKKLYDFECSDTMAEEVINLAISYALENIGSQRLNSKLNMRGLEA